MSNPSNPAIEAAIKEAFRIGADGLNITVKWLQGKVKERDPLGVAARRYAEAVEKRYNAIRVFGMSRPIPLRKLYIWVRVLEKITAEQWKTVEDLEKAFDRDIRGFGTAEKETKREIDAVNEFQKLVVLGKPGSGKTTLLKYITLQALDGNLTEKLVPIFITLRDFADSISEQSLMDFIVKEFDVCKIQEAELFVNHMLEKGRCILLLDGLDEVSEQTSKEVIRQICDFSDKYDANRFLLSCRIAAYKDSFEKFTHVELADFTDDQIKNLVDSWFGKGSRKAESCWSKLSDNQPIKELASSPLLLALLCIAFDANMDFPSNRAQLYRDAIDTLLRKWDASRSIERDEIYQFLSVRFKEIMFTQIAAAASENDQFFLPEQTLEKGIARFIENVPGTDHTTLDVDSKVILKSIVAQHGIFVERARHIYSFSHLTLQEYFTAKYVVDNAAKGALRRLVDDHLTDDKWRQVFLITAGMLGEADEFLLLLKERTDALLQQEGLAEFMKIIDGFIAQENKLYRSSLIAYTIYYVLSYHYFVTDLSSPVDLHRVRDLALAIDPDLADALNSARMYTHARVHYRSAALSPDLAVPAHRIQSRSAVSGSDVDLFSSVRVRGINLKINLEQFSSFDIEAIRSHITAYIQANKLLVGCLNTECYILKGTRQQILETLLTVSDSLADAP
ncbi:NACHT domain-containing protein [Candidatus Poribacteria bacterium]